jgi:outer membrane lipoprotein-sorting protein
MFAVQGFTQEFKTASNSSAIKSAIEKKHQATNSISAQFTEKVVSNMFKEPQKGYGNFLFKKENKVRWDKTSAKQLILINGETVKMYENGKALNNPTSQKIAKQIQGMMLSMLSGDFLNQKDFSIKYEENSKLYRLTLSPKSPRMAKYIAKIELLFSRSSLLLEEMTLFEKDSQKVNYAFSDIETNVKIDDSKFNQK